MTYLLDTCALSEFTKPKPSASVDAWFSQLPDGADFVSVVTLGELENGIAKLATSRRRASLERWFGDLRTRFSGRILMSTSLSPWSVDGLLRGVSCLAIRYRRSMR